MIGQTKYLTETQCRYEGCTVMNPLSGTQIVQYCPEHKAMRERARQRAAYLKKKPITTVKKVKPAAKLPGVSDHQRAQHILIHAPSISRGCSDKSRCQSAG